MNRFTMKKLQEEEIPDPSPFERILHELKARPEDPHYTLSVDECLLGALTWGTGDTKLRKCRKLPVVHTELTHEASLSSS